MKMRCTTKPVIPAKAGIQPARRAGNLLPTRICLPEYAALLPGYTLLFSLVAGAVNAAEAPYPNRPVRLVVSGVAGSSA